MGMEGSEKGRDEERVVSVGTWELSRGTVPLV